MKNLLNYPLAVLLLTSFTVSCSEDNVGEKSEDISQQDFKMKVIYGEDDRKDLYEIKDSRLLHLAKSTAVLMDSYNLEASGDYFNIETGSFGEEYNLCAGEPFSEQDSPGFCSGFLVGPKTLVTAGHCIRRTTDCNTARFIFDYSIKSKTSGSPKRLHKDNIYKCTKVIKSVAESKGADYAILELDRPVTGRTPLKFRTSGQIPNNENIVVIGHPSGIPTKVAGGAKVRSQANGFFVANLDTYGGNSGSAVFNSKSGEVEGVLVRGERDFVYKGNCKVSNVCKDNECRGEDVTRITEAAPYIPKSKSQTALLERLYSYLGFSNH